ncbi:MAG: hypothetical protein NT013_10545 [Planctomycetia bacterium]|nr:hypothetical protein [Planctomycetia bacterium]
MAAAQRSDVIFPTFPTQESPQPSPQDDDDIQGGLWSTFRVSILTLVVILVSIFTMVTFIEIRQNPEPARRLLGDLGEFLGDALGKTGSIGLTVLGVVVLIVIAAIIVAYIPFVFAMAAYVARDAHNRNHSGLGWAALYLAFQFLGLASVPLSEIFSIFGAFPAVVGSFVELLFGWTGFFIYLRARRPGIPTTCPNCRNKRLPYFTVCPHCGRIILSAN